MVENKRNLMWDDQKGWDENDRNDRTKHFSLRPFILRGNAPAPLFMLTQFIHNYIGQISMVLT